MPPRPHPPGGSSSSPGPPRHATVTGETRAQIFNLSPTTRQAHGRVTSLADKHARHAAPRHAALRHPHGVPWSPGPLPTTEPVYSAANWRGAGVFPQPPQGRFLCENVGGLALAAGKGGAVGGGTGRSAVSGGGGGGGDVSPSAAGRGPSQEAETTLNSSSSPRRATPRHAAPCPSSSSGFLHRTDIRWAQ